MSISFATITGCGITEAGRPFPPTELLWSKQGFRRADIDAEMMDCSRQLKFHPELKTYVQMTDIVDVCMLKKGFTFIPRPKGWMNVCGPGGFSETVGCKSSRGEMVITPDETVPVLPSNRALPSTRNADVEAPSQILSPSEQLLRQNLEELKRAQEQTQIKPYTPPVNVPVAPQVQTPRMQKLLKGN